jgi:hypothetical protein
MYNVLIRFFIIEGFSLAVLLYTRWFVKMGLYCVIDDEDTYNCLNLYT